MIKPGALFAAILLLVSMPFAGTYTKKYVSGGWLEVTRAIEVGAATPCPIPQQGVTDACAHSGASQSTGAQGGALTRVRLSLKNVGAQDRSYVNVGESLSFVPAGADVSFSPSPSQYDGRQAVWEINSLSRGETREVSYEFTSSVSEAAVGRIPDVVAAAAPTTVVLFAPSRLQVGGTLTLLLKSQEGRPISGAKILVDYPDGTRQVVKTDASGTASLEASREGSYTYSIEGYRLYELVSTIASEAVPESSRQVPAAASAADEGLLPGIVAVLPVFAGLFAAAVAVLLAYNFFFARRDDDYADEPAPQLAEQQAKSSPGATYSQNFSFGASNEGRERKIEDATRGMVESRKRHMQETAAQPKEREAALPSEGKAGFDDGEKTVAGSEMDGELEELERHARIAGEVAEQEKEVENMLSQLEAIRSRLRAGRGATGEEGPGEKKPQAPTPAAKPKAHAKKKKR
jgi:hypothetical protein